MLLAAPKRMHLSPRQGLGGSDIQLREGATFTGICGAFASSITFCGCGGDERNELGPQFAVSNLDCYSACVWYCSDTHHVTKYAQLVSRPTRMLKSGALSQPSYLRVTVRNVKQLPKRQLSWSA